MKETINQRIANYRRFRGFSQEYVAERLGMRPSTYSQCERRGKISCDLIIKLSEILDIEFYTLLFGEKTVNPKPTPPKPQHDFTTMEINIIKIIRNLKKQDRKKLIAIIQEYYIKDREKGAIRYF